MLTNNQFLLKFLSVIFIQKIEFKKLVVKSLKNRKNIDFNVISSQYGVVMLYVLLY